MSRALSNEKALYEDPIAKDQSFYRPESSLSAETPYHERMTRWLGHAGRVAAEAAFSRMRKQELETECLRLYSTGAHAVSVLAQYEEDIVRAQRERERVSAALERARQLISELTETLLRPELGPRNG